MGAVNLPNVRKATGQPLQRQHGARRLRRCGLTKRGRVAPSINFGMKIYRPSETWRRRSSRKGRREPSRHTANIKESLNNAARPSVSGQIRSTSRLEQEPGPTFCLIDPNLDQTGACNIPVFFADIVSFA